MYKRLLDADSLIVANDLDAHFTRIFGPEYQDEVVRLIKMTRVARPRRMLRRKMRQMVRMMMMCNSLIDSHQWQQSVARYIWAELGAVSPTRPQAKLALDDESAEQLRGYLLDDSILQMERRDWTQKA